MSLVSLSHRLSLFPSLWRVLTDFGCFFRGAISWPIGGALVWPFLADFGGCFSRGHFLVYFCECLYLAIFLAGFRGVFFLEVSSPVFARASACSCF